MEKAGSGFCKLSPTLAPVIPYKNEIPIPFVHLQAKQWQGPELPPIPLETDPLRCYSRQVHNPDGCLEIA